MTDKEIELRTKQFEMEIEVKKHRYGGLSKQQEDAERTIFNAQMSARIEGDKRRHKLLIQELYEYL